MKKSISLMVLCLSIVPWSLLKAQTGPDLTAESFFRKKLAERGIVKDFRLTTSITRGEVRVYECDDPPGFVLIKGKNPSTVAGYSVENRFTRDDKVPEPANALLEAISSSPEPGIGAEGLKTTYTPAGPFLRTTWSQEGYFNYYCPEDPAGPDGRVYVGCAAVAMGQIVRHFGKFNDFNMTISIEDTQYGTLTATLGNYDWASMEDRPIVTDLEVSRLLFGLGVLTGMNFSPSGSVTSTYSVYDGFKKLKYLSAIRMIRSATTPEVWLKNFVDNIQGYQPIYVAGSGHAYVCDGIDANGLFHFNLGWYGYADGFYPLSQVYNMNLSEAIFNIAPYSNNLPPQNLAIDSSGGQKVIRWTKNRLATVNPLYYRVYINDTTWYVAHETQFSTGYFPAGIHEIRVSAVYTQGESYWIGPIRYIVKGSPINISDPGLNDAILGELARLNITPNGSPTIDQLLKIQQLHLTGAIHSLNGIGNCGNLQVLTIHPADTMAVDLQPVSYLKRLRWLEVNHVEATNLDRITANRLLIHLDLDHSPPGSITFLTSLNDLIFLRLDGFPVTETQVLGGLNSLRTLKVIDCQIDNATFVQNLNELQSLDLSGNQLTRFRLTDRLPDLNDLNISRNQVSDFYFLENIPNIRKLDISHNLINRFTTGLFLRSLEELDMEDNLIDSIAFAMPVGTLKKLNIGHNRIRDIRYLGDYAPSLIRLDASGNRLTSWWRGNIQGLMYADLSDNQLDLIEDLSNNPSITHIDVSGNRIADIYPVFDHQNGLLIEYLNLDGNPLSEESYRDLAQALQTDIDTLILPPGYQPWSPGQPHPGRNRRVVPGDTLLSWESAALPAGGHFEVFTGKTRDDLQLTGQTEDPVFPVSLDGGRSLYWRINSILPDTSFTSGLFRLLTCESLALPYHEGFEEYDPFSFFTEGTPFWIRAADTTASLADGRIDPYRRSEGSQSLKLTNASDIHLPLGYLYQTTVNISMDVLVRDGSLGAVKVNDINGADLALYFKSNGRCDVILDNRLLTETTYPAGEWFSLKINLFASLEKVWIWLGSTNLRIDWEFTGQTARAGDLELASTPGPNWPRTGQAQFNVDNLDIRTSGILGTDPPEQPADQVSLYPNPAGDRLYIRPGGHEPETEIRLFDPAGKCLFRTVNRNGNSLVTIDVSGLHPGIYFVSVTTGKATTVRKFLVCR